MNSSHVIEAAEGRGPGGREKPLLARVENLSLHFDTDRGTVEALDDLSFDIYEGETVALVGETGCGKSVTARSFIRLVPTPPGHYPNGRVMFRWNSDCHVCGGDGCQTCYGTGREFKDVLSMDRDELHRMRSERVAMVFQDPGEALNPSLTIEEQIAESVLIHHGEEILAEAGVPSDQVDPLTRRVMEEYASPSLSRVENVLASIPPLRKHRKRIDDIVHDRVVEILDATQIPNPEEVTSNYPHELSGGQQQRVLIASALVAEPDLLIADEPTTALDVTIQTRILNLMDDLQERFDTSFLYITHDLSLVEEIADRVIVMYAGQVAEVAGVDDLYDDPLHPYTWGLLEAIPTAEKLDEELTGIDGSVPDMTNPPDGCRFANRCPEAMDHCSTVDPDLVEERPDHRVACHLYPQDDAHRTDAGDPVARRPGGGPDE